MPKRNPVKSKGKKRAGLKKKGKSKTAPKKEAPKKETVQNNDAKPKRKRKKKEPLTFIKLGVTKDFIDRFEAVFAWYHAEKENTATPNSVALEIFEVGLKTFESHMEDDGKDEEGKSWDSLPEAILGEDKDVSDDKEVVEGKDVDDTIKDQAIDVDVVDDDDDLDELGYDPDFEEAFQNYGRNF